MAVQEKQTRTSLLKDWETSLSEPARLLQEQAQTIVEVSGGVLYGVVEKSALLPDGEVAYHLDIGITGKQFRSVSVFIRHKLLSDYPVRVTNIFEDVRTTIHNAEAFKQYVCAILHSPATLAQMERMKEYAKKS